MSRSIKRDIEVDSVKYVWVLDGNTTDGFNETHIRVHRVGTTAGILYIDPYSWEFEVRPKFVANGILFAIKSGWDPIGSKKEMYISYIGGEYSVLPKGVKSGYQLGKHDKNTQRAQ